MTRQGIRRESLFRQQTTCVVAILIYATYGISLITPYRLGLLVPALSNNSENCLVPSCIDPCSFSDKKCFYRELVATVEAAIRDTDEWIRCEKKKKNASIHDNFAVESIWRDSGGCDEKTALGESVTLQKNKVDAIIGPPCPDSLRVVALLGSYWLTPVITWAPVLRHIIGQSSYDDVISVFGAFEDLAQSAIVVMKHLQWTNVLLVMEEDGVCEYTTLELQKSTQKESWITVVKTLVFNSRNLTTIRQELEKLKKLSRTIVLCMPPHSVEIFMTEADAVRMTSGYYAFLYLNFDILPLMVTFKGSDETDYSSAFLQLGQFVGTKFVNRTLHKPKRSTDAREDYLKTQVLLSPYLHDAVVVSVVMLSDMRARPLHEFNVSAPHLKTGPIYIDAQGIRRSTHTLVHYQQNEQVIVAMVTPDLDLIEKEDILWPGGSVPVSDMTCDAPGSSCTDVTGVAAGTVIGVLSLLAVLAAAACYCKKRLRQSLASEKDWIVDDREVKRRKVKSALGTVLSNGAAPGSMKRRLVRMETRGTLGLGSNCSLDKNMLYAPIGNYKDMVVAVKHVRWTNVQLGKKEMLQDLKTVKEFSHDNVNQFIGAYVSSTPGCSYVLFRYCSKGSLQDVLENDDIKLDWMFKLSFAIDLATGMEYIHKSNLRSHGNLKSSNCVIDSRWVLKVTDFGAITSYKKPGVDDDVDNRVYFNSLLWTAPEILRMPKRPHKGTQKGDVYSFGIIMQEILLRSYPYFYNNIDPENIIILVQSDSNSWPYRPVVPSETDSPTKAVSLMVSCWAEASESRPDFHSIRKKLREMSGPKRFNIMDNMLQMLESYSSNLEQLVTDRTEELEAEKKKTETLLYQMLPPSVAEQLKGGMAVIPESFDEASIFFSDIVGFTDIARRSAPLEVVRLLNDLYTCFDEVISRRDVYKVETIGDAYMCASGCPRKNGSRHSGEIANMALDLISAVTHFRISHMPEERLQLRVGLHTGPCAAGVVGRTMPRYCLFGDTVNTASRMESTGLALHIHMSKQMKEALDELDWGFLMVERGYIEVKGKGLLKTFWLAGKKNYIRPLPDTLIRLQKRIEEGNNPPTPSYCTLTVGDSMFSALRKTSITISNITVENSPTNSDSEDTTSLHCTQVDASSAASASAEQKGVLPKRRNATVSPAALTSEQEGQSSCWVNNMAQEQGNGEFSRAQNNENSRPSSSVAKSATKKDSACYSLSDNNSETDLTRVGIVVGSQSDLRSEPDQLVTKQFKESPDDADSRPIGYDSVDNFSFTNNSRATGAVRIARRKYNTRHGIIDTSDIPRIEIT